MSTADRRLRVVLLFGGRSAEHDVSCTSAVAVARALDPKRYEVVPVAITREGRWQLAAEAHAAIEAGTWPSAFPVEGDPVRISDAAPARLEGATPTAASSPVGITAGPGGNLWFTESAANKIGRISTAGAFMDFVGLTAGAAPQFITAGPDGNVWFTEDANNIGRITLAGAVTQFPIPTAGSMPVGVTSGPDGNIWFTENATNKIGKLEVTPVTPPAAGNVVVNPTSLNFGNVVVGQSSTQGVTVTNNGGSC